MRIAYLLADSEPSGGIRIVLAQADALIARGHEVTLVTTRGPVTWRATQAEWLQVNDFNDADALRFDFVVGTFWTTVRSAYELAGRSAVHLCQGYEGAFTAYAHLKSQIDDVYRLPIPKITVSRHLVPLCRAFYADATYVGQIVDDEFFRASRGDEHDPPRVLIAGQLQADMKGIDLGYEAVRRVRRSGHDVHLIRVSSWTPAPGEPLEEAAEFHVALPTSEMTSLMHSCDVLIAPNRRQEGFGLPAAEALASRVPAVLTKIPSYLSFDEQHDYALFAPEDDAAALGDRLIEAIEDRSMRDRIVERGAEVAEQFRAHRVAERLEAFFAARLSVSAQTRTSGR